MDPRHLSFIVGRRGYLLSFLNPGKTNMWRTWASMFPKSLEISLFLGTPAHANDNDERFRVILMAITNHEPMQGMYPVTKIWLISGLSMQYCLYRLNQWAQLTPCWLRQWLLANSVSGHLLNQWDILSIWSLVAHLSESGIKTIFIAIWELRPACCPASCYC